MSVILCYGDSNTHGTPPMAELGVQGRHARGDRWPDVLGAALGAGHEVLAEGLPGRTTVHDDPVEGGERNGLRVLPAILHSHKPLDLVLILLGTNDLKHRFSVTAFEIARSVERLALAVRAEGVARDILLVAPAPVRECGSLAEVFHGAAARQAGLAGQIAGVATRLGTGFFDAGSVVQVSPVDGVHWDVAAHHALGQALAGPVRARLAAL